MIKFGIDSHDELGINLHSSCPIEQDVDACKSYCWLAEDVSRRGFNVYLPDRGYIKDILKDSDQIEKVEKKHYVSKPKVEEEEKPETEVKGE